MTSIRILGRLAAAVAVIGVALYGGSLLAADGDALRALDKRVDGSAILNLVVTDGRWSRHPSSSPTKPASS